MTYFLEWGHNQKEWISTECAVSHYLCQMWPKFLIYIYIYITRQGKPITLFLLNFWVHISNSETEIFTIRCMGSSYCSVLNGESSRLYLVYTWQVAGISVCGQYASIAASCHIDLPVKSQLGLCVSKPLMTHNTICPCVRHYDMVIFVQNTCNLGFKVGSIFRVCIQCLIYIPHSLVTA